MESSPAFRGLGGWQGGADYTPLSNDYSRRRQLRVKCVIETKADARPTHEELKDLFAEGQRPYGVRKQPSSLLDIVPLRVAGRQRNDLNGPSTLIAFAILTPMMLFAVGAGISLLLVLNDLVAK